MDDFPAIPAERFGPEANELPVEMARFSSIAFLDQNYLLASTTVIPGGAWNPVTDLDPGAGGSFQDGVYVSDDGQAWAHLYVGDVGGQNTLVIAFRGTDDLRDVVLDYVPEFAPHWDRFGPLVSEVQTYIDRYAVHEVYVTGHSLGGAMAQWFLSEFRDGQGVQYHAFTFGSPGGPGGEDTEPRMLHFEHVDDPVPDIGVVVGAVRDGTRWRIDRDDNGSSPADDHHKALYVESLELLFDAGVPLRPPAFADQSANLFKGTNGKESIEGSNGVDVLYGMGGDDFIVGWNGNDTIVPGAGNDKVDGGSGSDLSLYQGVRHSFLVLASADGRHAVADQTRAEGIDVLRDIEGLVFADASSAVAADTSVLEYIASHADLMNAFGPNAQAGFDHYVGYGYTEGRSITFDGLEYIASYGDLIGAIGPNADGGAAHYITNGRFEGRTTSFDGLTYIASYGDLIMALGADATAGTSPTAAPGGARPPSTGSNTSRATAI